MAAKSWGGGTGIRAALRTLSRKGCGFKSHPQHRLERRFEAGRDAQNISVFEYRIRRRNSTRV